MLPLKTATCVLIPCAPGYSGLSTIGPRRSWPQSMFAV
jgi:hypothetical protein